MNFDQTHPDFNKYYLRWKMAKCFWQGGQSILQPDYNATRFFMGFPISYSTDNNPSDTSIQTQQPRLTNKWEWIANSYNSFLWKHPSETLNDYQERCSRATHLPIFQPFISAFVNGVLRCSPTRQVPNTDIWKTFHQNVDLKNTDIESFIRDALTQSLLFGRIHAITDATSSTVPISSVAQQRALGVRAYTYLISPLQLIDYELDRNNNFIWICVQEKNDVPRKPMEPISDNLFQYRIWTRNNWSLWQPNPDAQSNEKYIQTNFGQHPVGEVPISTLYTARLKTMACETPLSSVLDGDRAIFNKLSELDLLERKQTFSQLLIPEVDGSPATPIDIGPSTAITYPAEGPAPSYINSDPAHPQGLMERILTRIWALRVSAGISRGKAENSKEARSASAISAESEEKHNQMSIWSANTEEFDHSVHRHISKWEGLKDYPKATYPRNFDLRNISQQINDLLQLKSTEIISQKGLSEIAKPIVSRVLRENGIGQDVINDVLNELGKTNNG